jgi:hypothetical protein
VRRPPALVPVLAALLAVLLASVGGVAVLLRRLLTRPPTVTDHGAPPAGSTSVTTATACACTSRSIPPTAT